MGLNFSANWKHLKSIYKLKSSKNPGKFVDVYWVLENAALPSDLMFVPDGKDDRHYFLAVTKNDSAAAFGMCDGTSKSTLAPSISLRLLFPRHVLRPLPLITENTRCTTITTMTLRHHAPFAFTSFCYRRMAIANSSSRRKRLS